MERAVEYGPVPLLLGVVGHRRLPEPADDLRRVVRGLLDGFRSRYPSTPIAVLSSLAEGADRLVASEALDAGFSLVVPLPMRREEYERDFVTPESLAEFRSLLDRAVAAFVVPAEAHEIRADRRMLYANCGAYIARRSFELIALWDGKESSKVGGTAETVRFRLEGIPPPFVPEERAYDPSLCGPVIAVLTPRGPAATASAPHPVTVLYPRSALLDPATAFERAKYDLDTFNRDATRGPFASRVRGLTLRRQTEGLANGYQRLTARSLFAISGLVFMAVVAFNAYTIFPSHPVALLAAYAFFTAAAFVAYLFARRGEWQLRYQDYRALEQTLRTWEYWRLAGIERSVAARFAETERTKVDWVAVALKAVTEPFEPDAPSAHRASAEDLKAVYQDWIVDQQRYFTRVAGRRERRRERIASRVVTTCVALSIAFTIASSWRFFGGVANAVLFGATLFAVAAALVHNFGDKRGWSEHARHYELMAALFGYAANRIAPLLENPGLEPADAAKARAILISLGDEAIREDVAWLNLHRSRPVNVPRV
ncbi:MAG: hypothetical protein JO190_06950 [Candidatus Eremiobacteraeota bacterium]|nr:hypothetical protein [Candidatus Eremiobacteraeota bacterium]MBV8499048.1 hypothetical protein [Candidatus Eremiobacteraeota bacterium]